MAWSPDRNVHDASLEGKRILVTGGSRGIGRSIVQAFLKQGALVLFVHHADDAAAMSVLDECGSFGKVFAFDGNVADEASVQEAMRFARAKLGGIDVAVNNAGILRRSHLMEMTAEEFDEVIAVNLRGTFLVGRAAACSMRESGVRSGSIINLSSDYALLGPAGYSAYAATKAGVSAMTRCWARELAPDILVNAVAPGPTDTDMVRAADISQTELKAELDALPLRRIGRPDEIANIVLFLAGAGATYVTGQTFAANGGSAMA